MFQTVLATFMNFRGLIPKVLTVAMVCGVETSLAETIVPHSGDEWNEFGKDLLELYQAENFSGIASYEPTHGAPLLKASPGYYLATICLARALFREDSFESALPYFEKALPLQCHEHNLMEYADAVIRTGETRRFETLVELLRKEGKADAAALNKAAGFVEFHRRVKEGDDAFLSRNPASAAQHYAAALQLFEELAEGKSKAIDPQPLTAAENSYTYFQLSRSEYGRMRKEFLVPTFLEPKLAICETKVPDNVQPVTYRVTAFIIPNTDLTYRDKDGTEFHEKRELSESEIWEYKVAWGFATNALRAYSEFQVNVKTTYQRLEGATLTGLKQRVWNNLVEQRHLDPAKIVPAQDEAFKRAVEESDCIIFIWPRGEAAKTYGGGTIDLPLSDGTKLDRRGGILSISPRISTCLHELLHTVERRIEIEPVHGPKGLAMKRFQDLGVEDEIQWYRHLIQSIDSWEKVRYAD